MRSKRRTAVRKLSPIERADRGIDALEKMVSEREYEPVESYPETAAQASLKKDERTDLYDRGVEMVVNGVGMMRSAFVEACMSGGEPSERAAVWMETDRQLRETRNKLEAMEMSYREATNEYNRLLDQVVALRSENGELVQRLTRATDLIERYIGNRQPI